MHTFDKWLGNILAGILLTIILFALGYQIFALMFGRNPGGLYGSAGNALVYSDY